MSAKRKTTTSTIRLLLFAFLAIVLGVATYGQGSTAARKVASQDRSTADSSVVSGTGGQDVEVVVDFTKPFFQDGQQTAYAIGQASTSESIDSLSGQSMPIDWQAVSTSDGERWRLLSLGGDADALEVAEDIDGFYLVSQQQIIDDLENLFGLSLRTCNTQLRVSQRLHMAYTVQKFETSTLLIDFHENDVLAAELRYNLLTNKIVQSATHTEPACSGGSGPTIEYGESEDFRLDPGIDPNNNYETILFEKLQTS